MTLLFFMIRLFSEAYQSHSGEPSSAYSIRVLVVLVDAVYGVILQSTFPTARFEDFVKPRGLELCTK